MADLADLPTGTVTFLFTDLEGSTRLLAAHPDAYRAAVRRHHDLLQGAVQAAGGVVFETVGDAVYAAFARPTDAVAAALEGQLALQREAWGATGPLRARMGVHLGEAEAYPAPGAAYGARYLGLPLVRCARLMAAAHGGQVVLSEAATALVRDALPAGAALLDLGAHRLKDLARPERVAQLLHPELPADFPPLRSLDARPHNLPVQLTSFVGRERELAAVGRLLAAQRLVTLTGAGGVGKTRLALQAAADALDRFPDGVWLVDLAPLADEALVPQAVAAAVGVREDPGRPLVATVTDALRPKRLLLLLDNCEHLVGACARLADALLRACPHVRVLATSREALGVAGEAPWRVPSLTLLPSPDDGPAPAALARSEAVRLFVARAAAARPGFALTDGNAAAVARLCARLDGIPLALELAAARVRVLPVGQLLERLEDRFRLLTGGSRTALERHQTLRAAVDWSHALLTEPERRLFARLAVFAGGWTLEAAEAVCAGDGIEADAVLDLLTRLADKSLVAADEQPDGTARYRLLETLRQYAEERLVEAGGAAAARARHRNWYLALAERAAPELVGREQVAWLDRLEAEHDNLRAALEWCQTEAGAAGAGLRLAGALGRFWEERGHAAEGVRWLEQALGAGADAPAPVRATALYAAGVLIRRQGDRGAAARRRLERGLALFREAGDERGVAACLDHLAVLAEERGERDLGRALCEESLARRRALGDRWGVAASLSRLAGILCEQGDYGPARALLRESLALRQALGDSRGIAASLSNLGWVALTEGDGAGAGGLLREGLARYRALGNKGGAAATLSSLAALAQAQGDCAQATALYEESLALWRALGGARAVASVLHHLGRTALRQGDAARGVTRFRESLALCWERRDEIGITRGVAALAGVAAATGCTDRAARLLGAVAARLLGAVAARLEVGGARLQPVDRAEYERTLAAARARLGDAAFEPALAAGRTMTPEQAVAVALEDASDAA